jgi:hypothetical protein
MHQVNSVSWAPHEMGAILACASSDGKLSVLTFKSERQYPYRLVGFHQSYNSKTTDNGALTFLMAMQSAVMLYPGLLQLNRVLLSPLNKITPFLANPPYPCKPLSALQALAVTISSKFGVIEKIHRAG